MKTNPILEKTWRVKDELAREAGWQLSAVQRINMKAIFTLVLLLFAMSAQAAPRLSLTTVRGFPGNTVEVPVMLRYETNELQNVVALQADVVFGPAGLSSGLPGGGGALPNHRVASSLPASGVRRLVIYSRTNAAFTNGVIANLPFTVAAGQFRNFTLTLANVILARADGSQVPVSVVSGGIAVSRVFLRSDGDADFFLDVLPEQPFSIQASTNLIDWLELTNLVTTGSLFTQIDTDAHLYSHRFYRALPVGGFLGNLSWLNPGQFTCKITGVTGRSYVIQASSDMAQWQNLSTNLLVSGSHLTITNGIDPSFPARFYRLRSP